MRDKTAAAPGEQPGGASAAGPREPRASGAAEHSRSFPVVQLAEMVPKVAKARGLSPERVARDVCRRRNFGPDNEAALIALIRSAAAAGTMDIPV